MLCAFPRLLPFLGCEFGEFCCILFFKMTGSRAPGRNGNQTIGQNPGHCLWVWIGANEKAWLVYPSKFNTPLPLALKSAFCHKPQIAHMWGLLISELLNEYHSRFWEGGDVYMGFGAFGGYRRGWGYWSALYNNCTVSCRSFVIQMYWYLLALVPGCSNMI